MIMTSWMSPMSEEDMEEVESSQVDLILDAMPYIFLCAKLTEMFPGKTHYPLAQCLMSVLP